MKYLGRYNLIIYCDGLWDRFVICEDIAVNIEYIHNIHNTVKGIVTIKTV